MPSPSQPIWVVRQSSATAFSNAGNLPSTLCSLLAARGIEQEGLNAFLYPRLSHLSDPFLLPDMQKAVNRILQAIDRDEEICIYGDYDVDGISSVAILYNLLRRYRAKISTFIPRRSSEGYGLNTQALKRCMKQTPSPKLLICVDCATTSLEEISHLKQRHIDTIVVDHHEPSPQGLPDCIALVNPKCPQKNQEAPHDFSYLCAAGVVFKLAHALLKSRQLEGYDLKDSLDLAAMATIADIVPLQKENRILVRHGLQRMPHTKKQGLAALMRLCHLSDPISSSDIGYRIGPRINAAGRMDHPEDALNTLLCSLPHKAHTLAHTLNAHNVKRQEQESAIFQEALAMILENHWENAPAFVLGSPRWHPGIVGIVASRIMQRFHRPTFVIAINKAGIGKGSGRSIPGISLVEAIHANKSILEAGGGHAMAAGINIQEERIPHFRKALAHFVSQNIKKEHLISRIHIDAEIPLEILDLDFLKSYELLEPFGPTNPQPLFMASNIYLTQAPTPVKKKHLQLHIRQNDCWQEAFFFNAAQRMLPPPPWDIVFRIGRNTFQGRHRLQITIQDLRAHTPFS